MAKVGNHGIIIPRNKKLLARLYWEELRSLADIGRMYGVNHKSVANVFNQLGIPKRRRRSKEVKPERGCIICGKPCFKIRHSTNGAMYGRRCKKHWIEHRNKLAFDYTQKPEIRRKRNALNHRAYFYGPLKLDGEKRWLTRSRVLLRNVKRMCQKPDPARWRFRSEAFTQAPILQP